MRAIELFKLFGSIFVDNDTANRALDQTNSRAEGTGSKFGKMAGTVGKAMIGVGGAVIAGGTAILGLASKSAETADEIDKMSQKMGVSKTGFQEWKYIMGQNGMEIDKMQVGMKTLTSKMDGVKEGNKSAISTFKELGVSVMDSNGKFRNQEQVMNESIRKLASMPESAERARLATELFGKAGAEMAPMLNQGVKGIDDLKGRAHELGLVLSDESVNAGVKMGDLMDDVKDSFGAIVTKVGAELLPYLNQFLTWVLSAMPTIQSVMSVVFRFIGTAISTVVSVVQTTFLPIFQTLYDWFMANLPTMQTVFQTIFDGISTAFSFVTGLFQGNSETIQFILNTFMWTLQDIWNNVLIPIFNFIKVVITDVTAIVMANLPFIQQTFATVFSGISDAVEIAMDIITQSIIPILQGIIGWVQSNWPLIRELITTVIDQVKNVITNILNGIRTFWETWGGTILNVVRLIFDNIKVVIDTVLGVVKGIINVVLGLIKGDWDRVWNGIRSIVESVWNGIKSYIDNAINAVKAIIKVPMDAIKETMSSVWNSIKSTTESVWNGVKSAIETPINSAKNIVQTAIDTIKGMFNFSFKWPKLPMPHFSVKGSMNPLKWLEEGVPRIAVDWYAKGGIFDKPTLFNTPYGLKGVGEAGPEAVAPISKLKEYLGTENNEGLLREAVSLLKVLTEKNTDLYIDGDTLVGSTINRIDELQGHKQNELAILGG